MPAEVVAQPSVGGPQPQRGSGPGAHGPGPKGPPPGASGAALQDPSGFPEFHSWPAPNGPAIRSVGGWSKPVRLSEGAGGGYRPQVAVGADGTIHALFYSREDVGDLMVHRTRSADSEAFGPVARPGFSKGRNWGPDLVVRDNGSVAVVFDLADPGPASRGYFTEWREGRWSEPSPLTSGAADQEVGSGHVANGDGDWLAYVWIGKQVGMEHRFRAWSRWYDGSAWQTPVALSEGRADAWHTNVERRPDGSMLVGFDIGTGGAETTLYVAEGRNGRFSPLEDLTATGTPGERPHFAFVPSGDGYIDHVTYFHKVRGKPVHVYTRTGGPGRWGPPEEPSKGYGGFHFDPEIAADETGRVCLVWGWDSGREAELVYAIRSPNGVWSAPRRVASLRSGKPGLASLVAGPDGAFHVVWNQGVRGSNEVYYARLAPGAS
ncbi:MAG TPA: hypothetical protein DFR83_16565 [Deltaproteobacteria bacterium]|nr:hypothetical protein [Deltaproteobacteria bacterium]